MPARAQFTVAVRLIDSATSIAEGDSQIPLCHGTTFLMYQRLSTAKYFIAEALNSIKSQGSHARAAFARLVSPWVPRFALYIYNARRGHRLPRFERRLRNGLGVAACRAVYTAAKSLVMSQYLQSVVWATLRGFPADLALE
jgi:hypothetical protein